MPNSDENFKRVKQIVLENCGITIRDAAEDVGISIGSSHSIFSNVFDRKPVAAKVALLHDNAPAYTS